MVVVYPEAVWYTYVSGENAELNAEIDRLIAEKQPFTEAVCAELRLVRHATSLGSVESTIERRAAYAGQEHLPPGLLRLSVGIEACDDLVADLEQAFTAAGLKK